MSWRKARVYKCAICRTEEPGLVYDMLPLGWHGSGRKNGDCLCAECYMNIMRARIQCGDDE